MDGNTEPPDKRPLDDPDGPSAAAVLPPEPLPLQSGLEPSRAAPFPSALAGLQAGMVGVCWMLAWLGISAAWQRRSFWTAANPMATAFYGDRAIRSGFAGRTLSGIALYLLLYSLLGALFAFVLRDRVPRFRIVILAVVYSVAWYYLAFQVIWERLLPLVYLLHAARPMLLGHLVYGTFLGRFPAHIPGSAPSAPPSEPPPADPA